MLTLFNELGIYFYYLILLCFNNIENTAIKKYSKTKNFPRKEICLQFYSIFVWEISQRNLLSIQTAFVDLKQYTDASIPTDEEVLENST